MLDADIWGKRIKDLGDTNSPSHKRPSPAQKQREFEEAARRTLDDIQIPALPSHDNDVMDDDYHAEEDEPTGVPNPAHMPAAGKPTGVPHPAHVPPDGQRAEVQHSAKAIDGSEPITLDQLQKKLDERDRRKEQCHAGNVEDPPPVVYKTFAEAVDQPLEHKSGIETLRGVPRSNDSPSPVAMTATHTIAPT
jgi:hypothetical protein